MMQQTEEVLRTSEVAKLLCVANRTVVKMMDNGYLTGYRIQTGCKHTHRRIYKSSVLKLLNEMGIPYVEKPDKGQASQDQRGGT